jgi:predicted ATP-grasp superfamily ATP-dependent carboligase
LGHLQDYLLGESSLNIKKVLLTGGRAPGTLELARLFFKRNIEVHIAESFTSSLSKKSKCIKKFHIVSKPKQQTETFITDLIQIINIEKIDLYIPTCEEIFYVAKYKDKFPKHCLVFVDDFQKLRLLHHKFDFIQVANSYGLNTPHTVKVEHITEWNQQVQKIGKAGKRFIAKPVYSRFSNEVLFLPRDKDKRITINKQKQWVIQEYIEGKQYCSYSIVVEGEILAHTSYQTEYRAGMGASIAFCHRDDSAILNWVDKFAKKINFTGQIAFDFIKTESGKLYPIECNPRLTSGIHLFRGTDIVAAFTKVTGKRIVPDCNQGVMIAFAMILYMYQNIKTNGFIHYLKTMYTYKDVLFHIHDLKPLFYQFYSYFQFWKTSRSEGIDILEATTHDFSWDGEEI